ncbi:hypothetical protein A3K73_03230 [Candidatus Pacearchaeota archaeon RBG_13_36_9]|nr:MAG: hypothetical protein A3K73_03230 [Candidatus Pacearchaeota archaeon RBG_13_36_9]
MNKSIYLESKGSVCKLNDDEKTIKKLLEDGFTRHFIPDLRILERLEQHDTEVTADELKVPAILNYPAAQYRHGLPSRDIISLCEYLLERSRQEKSGFYSLNSATASKNSDAVTFFAGATNSGKTTSMLELVENCGFNFYSDEHSLLDLSRKKIVGGSRSIATRKKILNDRLSNGNEFYLKEFDKGEKDAALFIYPHLDNGLASPLYYQFSSLDFHWLLSRELGGIIRGVVKLTDNFRYPLPSLDTPELSERRVQRTIEFTKKVPCYYFQGSLRQMSDFVRSRFE